VTTMVARGNKGKNTSKSGTTAETVNYLDILDKRLSCGRKEALPYKRIVRGVKVDFEIQRVTKLLVSVKGQPRWQIALSDVHSIKRDAVTVISWDCLEPIDFESGREIFGKSGGLIGTEVLSEHGDHRGRVRTFWFCPVLGDVKRYDISRGRLRDLFTGHGVVTRDQVVSASLDELVTVSDARL